MEIPPLPSITFEEDYAGPACRLSAGFPSCRFLSELFLLILSSQIVGWTVPFVSSIVFETTLIELSSFLCFCFLRDVQKFKE